MASPSRSSRRALRANPLSFYISDLSTSSSSSLDSESRPGEQPHKKSLDRITEENSSNRSTGYITALPKWDNVRSPSRHPRPRIHVPLPAVPRRARVRTESQSPILEKETRSPHSYSGADRPDSQRSLAKPPPAPVVSDHGRHRRRKIVVWLVVVGLCVVVLAIILGIVLAFRLGPDIGGPLPTATHNVNNTVTVRPSPTPTKTPGFGASPSPTPLPASRIASAAVAGSSIPGPDGYDTIWLFWQNAEGNLSRSTFDSRTGNWTRTSNFAKGKKGTPLAAAALDVNRNTDQAMFTLDRAQDQAKASVMFLDSSNYINEWILPSNGSGTGQRGPLTQQKYMAHKDSSLASHWPHVVYQGPAGEIRTAHYACHEKNECWHERIFRTTQARNGTELVLTPLKNETSSLGLFYQEEGGRFLEYAEEDEADGSLWSNSAFSHRVPPNASATAFSTRRVASPATTKLNVYLLWQDANNTIQMSWTDNEVGWQGPISSAAFAGAEPSTALACWSGLPSTRSRLQTGTELARCYFQTGRALREVSFDGSSWRIVGVIPVDV